MEHLLCLQLQVKVRCVEPVLKKNLNLSRGNQRRLRIIHDVLYYVAYCSVYSAMFKTSFNMLNKYFPNQVNIEKSLNNDFILDFHDLVKCGCIRKYFARKFRYLNYC